MLSKKNYFNFLIFMMLVTTFLPIVAHNLPKYIGSFYLYGPIFIISVFLFDNKVIKEKNLLITIFITIFLIIIFPEIIWNTITDWNLEAQQREFFFIISALFAYYYYQKNNDFINYAKLTNIALIFILITAVMSIYSAFLNPMYARYLTGDRFSLEMAVFFKRLGGGGYGFANAIVGLIPIIVFYYKNHHLSKYRRWTISLFGFLILFVLLKMQIFGNIIIAIIIIILSFQGSKKIKKSIFIMGVIGIIAIAIPKSFYSNLLNNASQYFDPDSEIYYKLTDMSKFLETGDIYNPVTGAGGRAARYPQLFKAFINSPILGAFFNEGKYYNQEGAHLYWMNRLAGWGLFGFIIFLQIFTRNIKYTIKKIKNKEFILYYLLSIGAIIGYGLIKNIAGREVWFMFFFIIPGTYYLPLLNRKNFQEKKSHIRKQFI